MLDGARVVSGAQSSFDEKGRRLVANPAGVAAQIRIDFVCRLHHSHRCTSRLFGGVSASAGRARVLRVVQSFPHSVLLTVWAVWRLRVVAFTLAPTAKPDAAGWARPSVWGLPCLRDVAIDLGTDSALLWD